MRLGHEPIADHLCKNTQKHYPLAAETVRKSSHERRAEHLCQIVRWIHERHLERRSTKPHGKKWQCWQNNHRSERIQCLSEKDPINSSFDPLRLVIAEKTAVSHTMSQSKARNETDHETCYNCHYYESVWTPYCWRHPIRQRQQLLQEWIRKFCNWMHRFRHQRFVKRQTWLEQHHLTQIFVRLRTVTSFSSVAKDFWICYSRHFQHCHDWHHEANHDCRTWKACLAWGGFPAPSGLTAAGNEANLQVYRVYDLHDMSRLSGQQSGSANRHSKLELELLFHAHLNASIHDSHGSWVNCIN